MDALLTVRKNLQGSPAMKGAKLTLLPIMLKVRHTAQAGYEISFCALLLWSNLVELPCFDAASVFDLPPHTGVLLRRCPSPWRRVLTAHSSTPALCYLTTAALHRERPFTCMRITT